ncbi:C4-dicarboxylate TRAP transporter substrate-binding protein [uncultured Marinobacter sp.]|uniref:C4-dicarboxylate TRAP transporter substrate-binding protein n=1 Tax=uncultured Marinobacter sp. TaxID=187379 RepID=UPI0030D8A0BF
MVFAKHTLTSVTLSTIMLTGITINAAQAKEIRYATGYPPNSIGSIAADKYVEAIEEYSKGAYTARSYPQTLLSFMEMSDGLRDGLADSGAVLLTYASSQYPRANMLGEMSMLLDLGDIEAHKSGMAFAGAMAEYMFFNCPSCLAEFTAQNQVYAGAGASTRYVLLCNKPVVSLADVRGKRLRIGGANWARWAENLGASPVSMSVSEMYEGISQGVLDCTIQSTPELTIFKMMEVVTDITTDVPGGSYGASSNSINAQSWASLSELGRESMLYGTAVTSADITWRYAKASIENMQTARDMPGITVHEPAADLAEATEAFILADLDNIASTYQSRHDINNADVLIENFKPILERWVALVKDVDGPEALSKLYWDEVYSKVDVSTYGL